jgi:antirestriction protein ArdC
MPRTKQKTDHYQLVADQLLTLLQQGTRPWTRGWATTPYCNAFSGHRYSGLNPVLAEVSVMAHGYKSTLFVGFKQAQAMGLKMTKGSKATWLRLGGTGKTVEVDPDTGEKSEKCYRFSKWVAVYNLDCFTDEDAPVKCAELIERYRGEPNTAPRIDEAEHLVAAQQADIVFGGNRACYSPQEDRIHLPTYESFSTPEGYYATAIHELAHRTGHSSRLARDLSGAKGTPKYAFEELVADMAAAFVCSVLGIQPDLEHHASYLACWMQLIADDKQAFFRAYHLAQAAADLLLEKADLLPSESSTAAAI